MRSLKRPPQERPTRRPAGRRNLRWTRGGRRDETGATTVEYVGIVALVAILVCGVITITTPVKDDAEIIIARAFCKIGHAIGFEGCVDGEPPGFVPKDCQLSKEKKDYGGSVSLVVTVGGDTGYTIYRIRTLAPDGWYEDKYVVKTNGEIKGGVEFGAPGAEVDTGGSKTKEGGPKVSLEGSFATGSTYTFKTKKEAEDFVNKFKDQWGALGGDVDGYDKDSTYYELGGKAEVSGDMGPLQASASGQVVLGMESFKNGDKKYSLALTAQAALNLGIPVPDTLLQASANGEASVTVEANVTFDKDGNLKEIEGKVGFTAQADAGIDFAKYDSKKGYQPKHAKKEKVKLEELELPELPHLEKGASGELGFKTEFDDPDRVSTLGDALWNVISGNGMTDEQKAALADQINNHSQITFALNDYSHDEEKIGGKVHVLFVSVGAEGHIITDEENVINGWYYDPVHGTWEQNIACKEGA